LVFPSLSSIILFSTAAWTTGVATPPMPVGGGLENVNTGTGYYERTGIFTRRIGTKIPLAFFKNQITFTAIRASKMLEIITIPLA